MVYFYKIVVNCGRIIASVSIRQNAVMRYGEIRWICLIMQEI